MRELRKKWAQTGKSCQIYLRLVSLFAWQLPSINFKGLKDGWNIYELRYICAEGGEGRGYTWTIFLFRGGGWVRGGREGVNLLVKWREGKSDRFVKRFTWDFCKYLSHRTASNILKLPTHTHTHTHTLLPLTPPFAKNWSSKVID